MTLAHVCIIVCLFMTFVLVLCMNQRFLQEACIRSSDWAMDFKSEKRYSISGRGKRFSVFQIAQNRCKTYQSPRHWVQKVGASRPDLRLTSPLGSGNVGSCFAGRQAAGE
jgi:hypothetical protein